MWGEGRSQGTCPRPLLPAQGPGGSLDNLQASDTPGSAHPLIFSGCVPRPKCALALWRYQRGFPRRGTPSAQRSAVIRAEKRIAPAFSLSSVFLRSPVSGGFPGGTEDGRREAGNQYSPRSQWDNGLRPDRGTPEEARWGRPSFAPDSFQQDAPASQFLCFSTDYQTAAPHLRRRDENVTQGPQAHLLYLFSERTYRNLQRSTQCVPDQETRKPLRVLRQK
ncbi:hypothetical protein SKAU_G00148880 [Synaphobranchus kaupii]|uniref:Uncharacterized protein n=1 Tax=Synaphobranchus kaupii TaxID=118154 RepID=A0A9Q1FUR2_SYNKA|nr:hypothetical protein SKAU_G00148880 [Synaphobranchus kaupii]